MDVTREHINRNIELREMLLSVQTGFNLVNDAVVCAVLECISGLEPSSLITEPRYMKIVTVSSFSPFSLCVDATGVVCHQLGLLCAYLDAVGCGGFVETLKYFSSCSSPPAKPPISAKESFVIVLPPMLTVPS